MAAGRTGGSHDGGRTRRRLARWQPGAQVARTMAAGRVGGARDDGQARRGLARWRPGAQEARMMAAGRAGGAHNGGRARRGFARWLFAGADWLGFMLDLETHARLQQAVATPSNVHSCTLATNVHSCTC